jgi:predicted PurR-regulated permease PerM
MDAPTPPESVPPEPLSPEPASFPTNSQRRVLWTALTALALTSLLGVAALVFYGFISFLGWCYPILLPIGLAVIVALVLEPVVGFIQRRGLQREPATILVCVLAVAGFILFWAFLSAPLIDQGGSFFRDLPGWINDGIDKLQATITPEPEKGLVVLHPSPPTALPATNTLSIVAPPETQTLTLVTPELPDKPSAPSALQLWMKANLPGLLDTIQTNAAKVVYSAVGPVGQAFGFLLGFGFVPIYVYYFLSDQEAITDHWHDYVPLRRSRLREEVVSVLAEINHSLVSYFRGQIIVAVCNGVLTFIGLLIIGVPYSLVLGIITGALSIVPFLGIICSIIPALLLAFLSATDTKQWLHVYAGLDADTLQWMMPLLTLGVFAIVQGCESMFITPRVQSHSTGLHPLTIILGILFWSMLLPGLLGPIVAVPLTCAAVVLLRRYVWQISVPPTAK